MVLALLLEEAMSFFESSQVREMKEENGDFIDKDEELIEAMEALVETAANSVWSEIVHDAKQLVLSIQSTFNYFFPFIKQYNENPREEIWKMALAIVLCILGFLVLFVRRRRTRIRRLSRLLFQGQSSGELEDSLSSSRDPYEDRAEGERFEAIYPSIIENCKYGKLVLPPTCRLVEKPVAKKEANSTSGTATTRKVVEAKKSTSAEASLSDFDDNPVHRLQTYHLQFMVFIKSIFTFDYAGAAWTLMLWLQGIRKQRRIASEVQILEDDDMSQTSSLGSVKGRGTPVREKNIVREASAGTVESIAKFPMESSAIPEASSLEEGELSDLYESTLMTLETSKITTEETSLMNAFRKTPEPSPLNSPPMLSPERTQAAKRTQLNGARDPSQKYFFESANSRESIQRMNLELPTPDKNGYILDDGFLPDPQNCSPLLVFVNARSGPQQGQLLTTQLRRLLNPIQVWDLAHGPPEPVLESFCVFTRLRILVCGGDGTVSWILNALEGLKLKRKWPPVAICPLGTGNDLARIHGWGGGYNNESLITILEQVAESYVSLLDRWSVTIDEKKKKKEHKTFLNYLGVGADAQAALQVHYLRESRPDWFFSRLVNKAWYGIFGAEDYIKASSVNVRKEISVYADGVEIPLPSDCQGVIVMNIDSYMGGIPLWSHAVPRTKPELQRSQSLSSIPRRSLNSSREDVFASDEEKFAHVTACDGPSSCQDGLLDIVSIRGAFHLGQIKVGLSNAQRLCQCRRVTIKIKSKVAVQIDGEPWRQSSSVIKIERKPEAAIMLHRSSDDGGVETEMSKLLDWAEERRLIDGSVHSILMKEFSRRIESKTRQKRARQDNLLRNLKRVAYGSSSNLGYNGGSGNGGMMY